MSQIRQMCLIFFFFFFILFDHHQLPTPPKSDEPRTAGWKQEGKKDKRPSSRGGQPIIRGSIAAQNLYVAQDTMQHVFATSLQQRTTYFYTNFATLVKFHYADDRFLIRKKTTSWLNAGFFLNYTFSHLHDSVRIRQTG